VHDARSENTRREHRLHTTNNRTWTSEDLEKSPSGVIVEKVEDGRAMRRPRLITSVQNRTNFVAIWCSRVVSEEQSTDIKNGDRHVGSLECDCTSVTNPLDSRFVEPFRMDFPHQLFIPES
jgi:hypothetical protein